MKKIFLLAASLLVLNSNLASATCFCIPTTPQKNFRTSKAVFAGKVIDIMAKTDKSRDTSDSLVAFKVTFEVSKVWKGKVDKQQAVLTSESFPGCEDSFEKGKEYLVYASGEELTIQTALCNATKPLVNAQADLAVLEQETRVTPENTSTAQLQRNKQLWAKQNISNYRFTVRQTCFCSIESMQPVNIEVRNGKVTSIVPAIDVLSFNREDFTNHDSIAKLFDVIEDAIAKEAEHLSVTYHPTLGYPTKIDIDYDQMMADEEISLTIDNLQAVKNR
jgi:hypothetical protein